MLDTHARKWVQPIIHRTANALIKMKFTANQITWIAFILGASSGIWVIVGFPIVAGVVLWISGFLDAVDGTIARIQGKTSSWGTLMDITFDRVVELSVVIGLAVVYPQAQFALLVLTATIVLSMTIFLTVGALSEKKGLKSFYYQAGLAERTEGFILLTLMVCFAHWILVWTWIFVCVELITAFQRMSEGKKLLRE